MKLFRHEQRIFDRTVAGLNIQVVERGDQREMRFGNHIVQSARSLSAPDILVLDYTRAMMAGFLFAPQAVQILHFGLGGGSLPDFIHRYVPEARQRVVELNPGVIDVAFRYFELPVSSRLEVIHQEGAAFLQGHGQHYDMIFMDAFLADGAAGHLNSATFLRLLAAHLNPGGCLINNCWGSDRENLYRVRSNLRLAFPQLAALSVRAESNVIFIASRQARPPVDGLLRRRAHSLSTRFPLDFQSMLHRLRLVSGGASPSQTASQTGP